MSEGQGSFPQGAPEGSPSGPSEGQGNDLGQGQQQQGNQAPPVDWGSNDFLKNVAEADRPVVERYLKSIDAGITRRFQGIHEQYAPYKNLGDVEQLQQAQQIFQMLQDDPKAVYEALAEAMAEENGSQGSGNQGNNQNDNGSQQFEGLPPEFVQKFEQQEQVLQAVAQFILGQQEQTQHQQEDAQLEQTMNQLHAEFGEFDDEYVLAKAYANGGDLAKAVESYNATMQKSMNGMGQMGKLPPILGGGGVVPGDNSKTVKELGREDTQTLVANMLAAAQNQQ